MKETDNNILKYFFYFSEDKEMPNEYLHHAEHLLWDAERFIYEDCIGHVQTSDNPQKTVAHFVASYVSKWSPYDAHEIIKIYLKNVPSLKNEILMIYE